MQWGFKTAARTLAAEVRAELGLGPRDRLDPLQLAAHLDIPVWSLSELAIGNPRLAYLLGDGSAAFSAVTVFSGSRRIIVHNDGHSPGRQSSNLAHELSHGLLQHPATPALDNRGCRQWNQDFEDEASWLAGELLMTSSSAQAVADGTWTKARAAALLGISEEMVQFRVNATGAAKMQSRRRAARTWA